MAYKSSHFVPVMLKQAPRRRRSRGPVLLVIVLVIVAIVACFFIFRKKEEPFSTVVPTVSPAISLTPEVPTESGQPAESALPAESDAGTEGAESAAQPTESAEDSGKNPVETMLTAFSESLTQARTVFDELAERNALPMLSFSLALDDAGGAALDPLNYFTGLEKGDEPGEWGTEQSFVRAESGSYLFEKTFASGAKLSGTVSTAGTRLRFDRYEADSEQPYQTVELIKAADGYYGQVWQQNGLHQTVRFLTGDEGVSCALSDEQLESIYDNSPVSWESFSEPCSEVLTASAGGAVAKVGTTETICE